MKICRAPAELLAVGSILLAALQPSDVGATTEPRARSSVRCEAATGLAISLVSSKPVPARTVAFSDWAAFHDGDRLTVAGLLDAGWQTEKPSAQLAALYISSSRPSVVAACPDLVAALRGKGVIVDTAIINGLVSDTWRRGEGPGYAIYSMSLPVVSGDGSYALMDYAVGCGPTCGFDFMVLLKRTTRGKWVIVDRATLGMS